LQDGRREGDGIGAQCLRIDRLLFFLHLTKSRSLAQKWVGEGHIRVNGARVVHAHQVIWAGDILTLPTITGARIIRITTLPHRRGPASEAQACYCEQVA
jgi:ribosome-associated heat shock protein Hsp15